MYGVSANAETNFLTLKGKNTMNYGDDDFEKPGDCFEGADAEMDKLTAARREGRMTHPEGAERPLSTLEARAEYEGQSTVALSIKFHHTQPADSIPVVIDLDGVRWIPYTGKRMTPELIKMQVARYEANVKAGHFTAEAPDQDPGYFVTYVPEGFPGLRDLGRLGQPNDQVIYLSEKKGFGGDE